MGVLIVGGIITPPPNAPTLISPPTGTYEDLSGTPTFQWQYNPAQSGLTQSSWKFYYLENGGTIPQYWNVGTGTFQSTPIFNSGSTQTYTFPSGSFTDGNSYQWTIVDTDINGTSPAAPYFTVIAQKIPTVTVTTPAGTITASDPVVAWTASYPTGATQTTYRVVIYNITQYSAPGFVPGGTTSPDPNSVFDTGQQGSAYVVSLDLSAIPVYLPNNTQYRAYVQVTETGGQASAWAYSGFTVSYSPPKTPTVTSLATTDPTTGCPMIQLTVQGHDNLFSKVDAIAPNGTGTGTWSAGANTTLGSGTAPTGTFGLSMTATAGGNVTADTATGMGGYPVVAGTEYTAIVSLEAATTGRNFTVGLAWYESTGTLISTSTSASFLDNTTGWTQGYVTASAPVNAAYATVIPTVLGLATSEVHWFQEAGILLGTDTTWGAGGFVGLSDVMLLRSDGLYVRNASTANPAPLPAASQLVVVNDYEVYPTVSYTYGGTVIVTFPPTLNAAVLSNVGTSGSASVTTTGWWEFDPLAPSGAVSGQMLHWSPVNTEQSTAHMVTGQQTLNMVANTMLHQDFGATAWLRGAELYIGFQALLNGQKTIFISSPFGAQDTGYFRIGPASGGMSMGYGNKTKAAHLEATTASDPVRTITITAIAQNRPQV